MYFKQILNERCGCASYVVACSTKAAAIVDPAIDIEQYVALIEDRGLDLKYVIDTHVHADHVSGARALVAKYGAALCMHESAQVNYPFRPLSDGEEIQLGSLILRVVHTPGHRPELVSLLVVNPQRSPEPSMVLTGDSLLVGDVGRPDFGGGDASEQYESLSRLLRLPDWVAVFPGHFEGPCGKGMCGRPSTTIGFERLFNPLARMARPDFIRFVGSEIPARPLNMSAVEATNRGTGDYGWAMLTSSPSIPEVSVEQVASRSNATFLMDVREPEEFVDGHIPGAINIPQADIAVRLSEIPPNVPIYVTCHAGMRSLRAAQFLRQMSFESVSSVSGGTSAWIEAQLPVTRTDGAPIASRPTIVESDWSHGGGHHYEI
jgi:glyoxylase-like metal-dependent hydrolase (beta-lactamase superfamily II)/rhodanese-related sulfurtransferase